MRSLVRVVTSQESAARDASAIAAGIPSRALMQRAGAAAAAEIALHYGPRLGPGVLVAAGPGNNGGDAWVVARALAASGVRVRVAEPLAAKSDDARAERALTLEAYGTGVLTNAVQSLDHGEALVIDGLLGTGATGAPRGDIGTAVHGIRAMRDRGATVVALDVPTGLDATSGAASEPCVAADVTVTFGTMKRGHLVNRDVCGRLLVLDIGLGAHAGIDDRAPELVDEAWVAARVPAIGAEAHKGIRKKLAIVGGAEGMAGASILAARAALRSGIGMVKLVVAPGSLRAVQETEPAALAATWPADDAAVDAAIGTWPDVVVLGPGLGHTEDARALVERVLSHWKGPVVLDADALNVFRGDPAPLASLLGARAALITPHPAEFARLFGGTVDDVLAQRFDIGLDAAARVRATALLKGVPTVITSPSGERLVSAAGTPVLATAGSGDVLSGIAGTLLAQTDDAFAAGAAAAWVHGRAAERASSVIRGITLDDVLMSLRDGWTFDASPTRYPVLADLAAVGERR